MKAVNVIVKTKSGKSCVELDWNATQGNRGEALMQ